MNILLALMNKGHEAKVLVGYCTSQRANGPVYLYPGEVSWAQSASSNRSILIKVQIEKHIKIRKKNAVPWDNVITPSVSSRRT